jgi:hypothetical protein
VPIVIDDNNPDAVNPVLDIAGLLERLPTPPADDAATTRLQRALDDATGRAAAECCLPDPLPAGVASVIYDVALRAYGNRDGLASENLGSYGYSRAAETARAGAYLTPDEIKSLRRACRRARNRSGVSSVKVLNDTYPRRELDDDYELDDGDPVVVL